jgi:hypothetical protein
MYRGALQFVSFAEFNLVTTEDSLMKPRPIVNRGHNLQIKPSPAKGGASIHHPAVG